MPAPHSAAAFGSSKKNDDAFGRQHTGSQNTKKNASNGGNVTKAGRVLIFFTHFPLETPFLKAAVRPRSLPLSPCLTVETRSLPHCWRWPPFTDPQPRECLPIICYYGLHFFYFFFTYRKTAGLGERRVCVRHFWVRESNSNEIHGDILQLQMHI